MFNRTKKGSKGNLNLLQTGVLTLVVVGILLGIGLQIIDQTQTAICSGTSGCTDGNVSTYTEAVNSTNAALTSVGDFSDWMTIIVVVIAGAVIFGLLTMLSGSAVGGSQRI